MSAYVQTLSGQVIVVRGFQQAVDRPRCFFSRTQLGSQPGVLVHDRLHTCCELRACSWVQRVAYSYTIAYTLCELRELHTTAPCEVLSSNEVNTSTSDFAFHPILSPSSVMAHLISSRVDYYSDEFSRGNEE